jgi:hypothetical protein
MNIHSLAHAAGYTLPEGAAEKELRHEAAAVSADSVSVRILSVSALIRSRTHIELYWDEIIAFERGTKLRTLLEKRMTIWSDITKPVTGRSSKRSYATQPKNSIERDPKETGTARLAAAWERVHAKDRLAASTPSTTASSQPPSDPTLKSIDENLRMITALKALEMQAKAREMGEAFRDSIA